MPTDKQIPQGQNASYIPISSVSRRRFIQGATAVSSGALLERSLANSKAEDLARASTLPRRVLGSTGQRVSVLGLGTAPCGQSKVVDTPTVISIVDEAIDLGIDFIDSARIYGNAEEAIGKALGNRRKSIFLTTKVWADDAAEARKSLETSLRELKTDHVDLVYLHSLGNRNVDRAMAPGGALSYLVSQKAAGKTRFVGISGHSKPETFVRVIDSGMVDVVMMAMNFVDRHVYGFEEKVLPAARRKGIGVVCMKVFGGIRGAFASYTKPNPGAQLNTRYMAQAVRYAMDLQDVGTMVIGPHTVDQLRQNIELVRAYKPLTDKELLELDVIGKRLASDWGPRFGPIS